MFLPKPYLTGYGCATLCYRDYAKTHCKKPEPGSAVIVELDEFWHFIESKKSYGYGKLMNACGTQAIVIEVDSLTGNWEVVNGYATLRYRQTLRKLLDRLAQWQVTVYCTDHWEAYASELEEHPEAHHVETKTETRNIERNNSDHRHWFARFRRKSKVVSKSKEMVELTLALFAKLRVNETINSMRDSMLALLT
jgi:Transposase and inactivated derivatives, IS1 family